MCVCGFRVRVGCKCVIYGETHGLGLRKRTVPLAPANENRPGEVAFTQANHRIVQWQYFCLSSVSTAFHTHTHTHAHIDSISRRSDFQGVEHTHFNKIGRASCRERVSSPV